MDRRTLFEQYSPQFGHIQVCEEEYEGNPVRMLLVNGGQESACFRDETRRHELVFDYTEKLDRIFAAMPELQSTLLIGGAGFSYPRYYISHYPKRTMTVIEINALMPELARRYFWLDELWAEYDLAENRRLEIYIDDGSHYLKHTQRRFDAILNDAYVGDVPDRPLQERTAIEHIRDRLNPDGVYIINLIAARSGPLAASCAREQALLREYFAECVLIPCDKRLDPQLEQNCILLASDRPLKWLFRYF